MLARSLIASFACFSFLLNWELSNLECFKITCIASLKIWIPRSHPQVFWFNSCLETSMTILTNSTYPIKVVFFFLIQKVNRLLMEKYSPKDSKWKWSNVLCGIFLIRPEKICWWSTFLQQRLVKTCLLHPKRESNKCSFKTICYLNGDLYGAC